MRFLGILLTYCLPIRQLESRLRPIKAKQGQIDNFVERQEKRAEMAKSRLEQGRRDAEDLELVEVRAAREKARKRAVASGVDGAGEVSESLLKPTKALAAAMLVRERRQQEEVAALEASAAKDEARRQRLGSPQSSPRVAAAAEATVEAELPLSDTSAAAPQPQPPMGMPDKPAVSHQQSGARQQFISRNCSDILLCDYSARSSSNALMSTATAASPSLR